MQVITFFLVLVFGHKLVSWCIHKYVHQRRFEPEYHDIPLPWWMTFIIVLLLLWPASIAAQFFPWTLEF